jgi:hypothetical protein
VRREVLYNILIEFGVPMKLVRLIKMCLNETCMHNEDFHDLYSSPSIIRMIKSRRMRWAGHVARMGEKRNAYCRWVDNIRMDLGEVGWGDVDWIGLAQDKDKWRALVNAVMSMRRALKRGSPHSQPASYRIPGPQEPSLVLPGFLLRAAVYLHIPAFQEFSSPKFCFHFVFSHPN